jgi:hypothetical protein
MNNWKLVYCFSKMLSDDDKNFNIILYSLTKSIKFNSKFHQIKIYTDKFTYKFIKHLNVDIQIYDYKSFRFIDDIKIQTLPLLSDNEILIDPDVFLYKELIIDSNCDILLERPEKINSTWYLEDFSEAASFKFRNFIKLESKSGEVGNIGIIKFFNLKAQKEYINLYNKIRDEALLENDKLPPFPKFSFLLGQLGLQNLIDDNDYILKYSKQIKENDYIHISGYRKYSIPNFIDRLVDPKVLI